MHSGGPDPVQAALTSGTLKIEHAANVLTLDPKRRVIRDGAILVEGGRIAYVGKTAELAQMSADNPFMAPVDVKQAISIQEESRATTAILMDASGREFGSNAPAAPRRILPSHLPD
jgi:hypothetical protein